MPRPFFHCWTLLLLLAATAALAEDAAPETAAAPPCAGGAVIDDGTVETGYGFVPSANYGIYVQELRSAALPTRHLDKVCVCWLKTRGAEDVDFQVLFYEDAGGRPAEKPYAAVPGHAEDVPRSVKEAGRFYEVDASGVEVPQGTSYVGVRWNPSEANFLFVCTDTSEGTVKTPVFFREDRQPGWAHVFTARDPIFKPHRAILVRTTAGDGERPPVAGLKLFKPGAASATPAVKPGG